MAREPNQDGAGAAAELFLDEVFLAFERLELLLLLSRGSLFKYCDRIYQLCREQSEGWITECLTITRFWRSFPVALLTISVSRVSPKKDMPSVSSASSVNGSAQQQKDQSDSLPN